MSNPVRIEIDLEMLAVEGLTGREAAALIAATERALNTRFAGGTNGEAGGGTSGEASGDAGPGATTAIDRLAGALATKLAAAIRDGRGRTG
jgi:hypothetical protein